MKLDRSPAQYKRCLSDHLDIQHFISRLGAGARNVGAQDCVLFHLSIILVIIIRVQLIIHMLLSHAISISFAV